MSVQEKAQRSFAVPARILDTVEVRIAVLRPEVPCAGVRFPDVLDLLREGRDVAAGLLKLLLLVHQPLSLTRLDAQRRWAEEPAAPAEDAFACRESGHIDERWLRNCANTKNNCRMKSGVVHINNS